MGNISWSGLCGSVALAASLCGASWALEKAGEDSPATMLVLGTATQGGGFQLFGQNLAEVINSVDPTLRVEAIATRGSGQNLNLLENREIDVGLVEGNAAHQALGGIGRAPADLRILGVMYPNAGTFVVRADSPYRTLDDLRGQPVAFGTRSSGLRILANDVLDGLGLSPERDFEQLILDKAGDGPRMLFDGSAAALWGAGIGWPGFVQIADSEAGARFIPPTAEQVQQVLARHPHLRPMSIPANTYRGQDQAIDSVGMWSMILIRSDLSDDIVYRLARAIHRGEPMMAERLPQGRFTTAGNAVREVPLSRLHPGAVRYYREAGLLR